MGDRPSMRRRLGSCALFAPAAAVAVVLLFNIIATPGFLTLRMVDGRLSGPLVTILDQASPVMLVAIGMSLVIATGGIDLSVGAVMAIGGAVAVVLINAGWSIWTAIALALAAGAALGACTGVLVSAARMPPLIATLALMVAGRGIAQTLTGGQTPHVSSDAFARLASGSILALPVPVVVVLAAATTVALAVRATASGLFIQALGASRSAAILAGIPAATILVLVYGLSALLSAGAGVLAASEIMAADANTSGLFVELDAILAVVLGGASLRGGRFSIWGAVLGALLMQSLTTTIIAHDVPVQWVLVVKAAAVLIVCALQSRPGHDAAPPSSAPLRVRTPMIASVAVLFALCIAAAIAFPMFRAPGAYFNILGDKAFLGLCAVGMTFVVLTGGIDLSVGSMIGLSSIAIASMARAGIDPFLATGIMLCVGALCGTCSGALIACLRLQPFLVTLGMLFLLRGLAYVINVESLSIADPSFTRAASLGPAPFSIPVITLVIVAAASALLVHATPFGTALRAIGSSEESARLMGVPAKRTLIAAYACSGFTAALGGAVFALYTCSGSPAAGLGLELDAIAAIVIGGTALAGGVGSPLAALAGLMTLGIIDAAILADGRLSSWSARIVAAAMLLAFTLTQSISQRKN